jgi:proline dehydrogenase
MNLINKLVVGTMPIVPKFIVKQFSKRYIAGEKIEDAARLIKNLNSQKMVATIDLLGEFITKKEEAQAAANIYKEVLQAISKEKIDSNVSLKLTQMGLKLDSDFCYAIMKEIIGLAKDLNNFVRIDMEDSSCTTDTIKMYLRLKKDFNNSVGVVLQAYLRRTIDDIKELIPHKPNIRLCKGIYIEPREIAYKERHLININFVWLLEELLKCKAYVGIATHDEELVLEAFRVIDKLKLEKNEYEFQMLLGVDEELRNVIVNGGNKLRVYVPFGEQWYAYSTRRLKENPNIAGYIIQNLFK